MTRTYTLRQIKDMIHQCGMACEVDCTEQIALSTEEALEYLIDYLIEEKP